MRTGGGEGGRRFAADLEQDLARLLAWGASPPSCSRSAHPAWPAPRGLLFHPEGRRQRGKEGKRGGLLLPLQGELHRLEGKRKRERKKTSRSSSSFFRETFKTKGPLPARAGGAGTPGGASPDVREALEDFFGGDLPDPVDLVAGHYEVEPGDGELYLAIRMPGGWIEWDAEQVEVAGKVWRWVMGIDDGKAA
jgi:hypothetical protein